jgi:hypothetical protein
MMHGGEGKTALLLPTPKARASSHGEVGVTLAVFGLGAAGVRLLVTARFGGVGSVQRGQRTTLAENCVWAPAKQQAGAVPAATTNMLLVAQSTHSHAHVSVAHILVGVVGVLVWLTRGALQLSSFTDRLQDVKQDPRGSRAPPTTDAVHPRPFPRPHQKKTRPSLSHRVVRADLLQGLALLLRAGLMKGGGARCVAVMDAEQSTPGGGAAAWRKAIASCWRHTQDLRTLRNLHINPILPRPCC